MSETRELPKGWVWARLGEVCHKPQYGWTTKANPSAGSVRLLRTTDITKGRVDWDTVPYCTEVPEDIESYLLHEGDLVISRAGSVGFSYLLTDVPVDSVFASYLIRFRPRHYIDGHYLSYFLQTPEYWARISEESVGIALANVNARKLESIDLPLAPLAEQRRIVAAIEQQFTRLDAGVAALRRARAALKRYRAAVLKAAVEGRLTEQWRAEYPDVEAAPVLLGRVLAERRARWEADLRARGKDPAKARYEEPKGPDVRSLPGLPEGWCWATPDQLASREKYALAIGPFGSNLKVEDYCGEGVPLIFVRNIRSGIFNGASTRYISEAKAEELRPHIAVGGDILVTKMGDPPGDACLYPKTAPTAVVTADCIKWTLSPILPAPLYFVHAINSEPLRNQILGITKGVAQLKVSLDRFKSIGVPLAPLAEQEQIVAEVERRLSVVGELEATVEANLKRAERLRQSILREAFAGRLVAQDASDEPAEVMLERMRGERERANGDRRAVETAPEGAARHETRVGGLGEREGAVEVVRQVGLWGDDGG